jgi:hypothetical protein
MENMTEISSTGFFFSRNPDGSMSFARNLGEQMEEMDAETFSQVFGSEVEQEDARKQAAGIITEYNSSRRTNFSLAPFQMQENRAVEKQQEMNSVLGSMMV